MSGLCSSSVSTGGVIFASSAFRAAPWLPWPLLNGEVPFESMVRLRVSLLLRARGCLVKGETGHHTNSCERE